MLGLHLSHWTRAYWMSQRCLWGSKSCYVLGVCKIPSQHHPRWRYQGLQLAQPKQGGVPTYSAAFFSILDGPNDPYCYTVEAEERHERCCTGAWKTLYFLLLQGPHVFAAKLAQHHNPDLRRGVSQKEWRRWDCCAMSVCDWGHARMDLEEYPDNFDNQDHMDHVGEFQLSVNETCLLSDRNIFGRHLQILM